MDLVRIFWEHSHSTSILEGRNLQASPNRAKIKNNFGFSGPQAPRFYFWIPTGDKKQSAIPTALINEKKIQNNIVLGFGVWMCNWQNHGFQPSHRQQRGKQTLHIFTDDINNQIISTSTISRITFQEKN